MRVWQSAHEIVGLTPGDANAFFEEQGVPSEQLDKYVNFCNSISVIAPLQCSDCPNIGVMAVLAFDGTCTPKETEMQILETMNECHGAELMAQTVEGFGPGYECQQDIKE